MPAHESQLPIDRKIRRARLVRGVWAACLIVAALNHARILLQHGLFWDYHGAPAASAVYWTSLTLIDPIVAALLLARSRIGVPATVLLITTNVIHNIAIRLPDISDRGKLEYLTANPQVASQIGFLLFVVLTWKAASADFRAVGASDGQPG